MRKLIIFFLILLASACTSDELDSIKNELNELKKGLGNIQYMAIDPQISFSIKDVEFLPPDSIYGSPSVKYRLNLKQNNNNFPLSEYKIHIIISILDTNGSEIDSFSVISETENGVLSIAEEETLFGFKKNNFDGLNLAIKNYSWNPNNEFYEYHP